MAMDEKLLEELADCIPGDAGRLDGARSRLLGVQEIMRTLTDHDHGLTAAEIREILRLRNWQSGKTPSEPAILDDLKALADSDLTSLSIEKPGRGTNAGFRCTKTALTSAQVRLLLNMVRTCKFITLEDCRELCDNLENMISIYQQDKIVEDVVVDERTRPVNPDAFTAADIAAQAIRRGKKISFEYCYHGFDGEEHLIENVDGSTVFTESPVALVFSFGDYYLETLPATIDPDDPRKHRSRRLDRVRNPRVSLEDIDDNPLVSELRESASTRTSQTFDMYGSGTALTLFLRVHENASNVIFDRFGHSCKFEHVTPKKDGDASYGYVCVSIQPSPTFFRWLFGMGSQIVIEKPKGELWSQTGSWNMLPYMKDLDDLCADYAAAIDGYKRQFEIAASPYEGFSFGADVSESKCK